MLISHSWYTLYFEPAYKKPPFIRLDTFSIKLSDLQSKEDNKITTIVPIQ